MNFNQTMQVFNCNDIPRLEFFQNLLKDKWVLHIGCVDNPFIKEHNLHIALQGVAKICDGFDTNINGYDNLRQHLAAGNKLLRHLPVEETYDYVIIPEVLEHVSDLTTFFNDMKALTTEKYLITVPCAVQCGRKGHFYYDEDLEMYKEEVHPEHLVWYTPYTLMNTIQTYTDWKINSIFWINNISVGAICTK